MLADDENSERQQTDESLRLERERADADEAVRSDRAEHLAFLSNERDATDRDLLSERARSDDVLATRDEFPGIVRHDIRNMPSNAVKFTPAGGKVVVRLERIGDELAFAVIDTGIGISEDKLEDIFERFLQGDAADRRGLGLGLYISRCIVEGHGGRIWAESRLGEGSAFHFTLPIVSPAA